MNILRIVFSTRYVDQENRIVRFDFIKGLAMLLVLFHHSRAPFGKYILAFHMPLFFILSGYMRKVLGIERYLNSRFLIFVKSKVMRLLVPYFCFEFFNLIVYALLQVILGYDTSFVGDAVINIILCSNKEYVGLYGRLWFIPCIFLVDCFSFLVLKYTNTKKRQKLIILLFATAFFVVSFIITKVLIIRIPFTFDISMMATGYYLLGYAISDVVDILLNEKSLVQKMVLSIVLVVLLFVFVKYGNASTLMYNNEYGNMITSIVAAIVGSLAFFIISNFMWILLKNTNRINNYVLWFGVNSLAVFPIHLFIKVFCIYCLGDTVNWIIILVSMMIGTIPLVNIVSYLFPFVVGRVNNSRVTQ